MVQTSDQICPTNRNLKNKYISSADTLRLNKPAMKKFLKNLSFEVDVKVTPPMYKIIIYTHTYIIGH